MVTRHCRWGSPVMTNLLPLPPPCSASRRLPHALGLPARRGGQAASCGPAPMRGWGRRSASARAGAHRGGRGAGAGPSCAAEMREQPNAHTVCVDHPVSICVNRPSPAIPDPLSAIHACTALPPPLAPHPPPACSPIRCQSKGGPVVLVVFTAGRFKAYGTHHGAAPSTAAAAALREPALGRRALAMSVASYKGKPIL